MCILLYVKLIWCSGSPYIYGQLEEGGGQNLFCVVVFHRSMVDWKGGTSAKVYMDSAICETDAV